MQIRGRGRGAVCPMLGIGLLIGAFASAAVAMREVSASGPVPGLVIDAGNGAIGTVRQGESATATYRLRNRSGKTVLVSQVVQHCHCTSHTLSEAKIPAGEIVTLNLTLAGGSSRGNVAALASVLYFFEGENDLYRIDLDLSARVTPDIDRPDAVAFELGRSGRRVVTLIGNGRPRFRVTDVSCTHRAFVATAETLGRPTETNRVFVTFDGTAVADQWRSPELLISTDSTAEPVMRVPLRLTDADSSAPSNINGNTGVR